MRTRIEIIANDNPKEREDRYGRVRVNHRRTWILMVDGSPHWEYATRKEAVADGKRLAPPGVHPVVRIPL